MISSKFKIEYPFVIYNASQIKRIASSNIIGDDDINFDDIDNLFNEVSISCDKEHLFFDNDVLPIKSYPICLGYNENDPNTNDLGPLLWSDKLYFMNDDYILNRTMINGQYIPNLLIDDGNPKSNNMLQFIVRKFQHVLNEQKDLKYKLVKDNNDPLSFFNDYVIILNHRAIYENTKVAFVESFEKALKQKFSEIQQNNINLAYFFMIYNICQTCIFKMVEKDGKLYCYMDGSSLISTNPIYILFFIFSFGVKSVYHGKKYQTGHIMRGFMKYVFDNFNICFDVEGLKTDRDLFYLLRANDFDNKNKHEFDNWEPHGNMTYTTLFRIKTIMNLHNDANYAKYVEIHDRRTLLEDSKETIKDKDLQIKKLNQEIEECKSKMNDKWNSFLYSKYTNTSVNFKIDNNYEIFKKPPYYDNLERQIKETESIIIIAHRYLLNLSSCEETKNVVFPSCSSSEIHSEKKKTVLMDDDEEEAVVVTPKKRQSKRNIKSEGVKVTMDDLKKGKVPVIPIASPSSSSMNRNNDTMVLNENLLNRIIIDIEKRTRAIIQEENEKLFERVSAFVNNIIDNDINALKSAFSNIDISSDNTPAGVIMEQNIRKKRTRKQTKRLIDELSDLSTDHDDDLENDDDDSNYESLDDEDGEYTDDSDDIECTIVKDENQYIIDDSDDSDSDDDDDDDQDIPDDKTVAIYIKPNEIYSKSDIKSTKQNTIIITNHEIYRYIKENCDEEKLKQSEETRKYLIVEILNCFMRFCCLSNRTGVTVIPHGFTGFNFYIPFDEEDDDTFFVIKNGEKTDEYDISFMKKYLELRKNIFSQANNRIAINTMLNNIQDKELRSFVQELKNPDLLRELGVCSKCRTDGEEEFKKKSDQYKIDRKKSDVDPNEDPNYTPMQDYLNYKDIMLHLADPLPKVEFDENMEYCFNCNNCFHYKSRNGRKRYILVSPNFEKLQKKTWKIIFSELLEKKVHILCDIPLVNPKGNNNQGVAFCSKECANSFKEYNEKFERFINFKSKQ